MISFKTITLNLVAVQVRLGMGDGDPATRAEARKAYWAFGDAFRCYSAFTDLLRPSSHLHHRHHHRHC